jgi:non-homologous end joining protein Ku
MPRSIWNGTITFALVNVPVKLYEPAQKEDVPGRTRMSKQELVEALSGGERRGR